jgi:hypothetical protein
MQLTVYKDMFFSGSGSGLPYGEIYIDNGIETKTLTTSYSQVTNFDTEGANGVYNLMTPDKTNNKLTITTAGTYKVSFSFSGKSSKVSIVYVAIFVDGVEKNSVEAEGNTVENGYFCLSSSGFLTIDANKDIDLRMKYAGAEATVVTLSHININAVMVGG